MDATAILAIVVLKLPAVETLGSTNVICTDKTGTLAVGEMTVRALYCADESFEVSGEGYNPVGAITQLGNKPTPAQESILRELLGAFAGCNNSHLVSEDGHWKVIGDPTEGALLTAAGKMG